ncbi:hypothetical protein [Aureibacter tunicatorum]|uniref:Uncharacterized protein n=1 Tax=Aureibacter tunicatorum TaxID=866807 RepID=A0AAE4BQW5_9BACT|nr:hypothetical protein [Aureibacter tunicatorum]MDR6237160.1 hypothetical protein [Aureibacter tunicatorum]BDD06152.1 hypothetical protein AUTU_36350 [Aureibacter tunicatorum]
MYTFHQGKKSKKENQRGRGESDLSQTPVMLQRQADHEAVFGRKGIVQRAVGFEIENGKYRIFKDREVMRDYTSGLWEGVYLDESEVHYVPFRKGEVLLEGDGFTMQVDISHPAKIPYMEIVTDPFPETTHGYESLTKTMSILENMMEYIRKYGFCRTYLSSLKRFGSVPEQWEEVVIWSRGYPAGSFQMTAGIKLSQVSQLMEDLGFQQESETPEMTERKKNGRDSLMKPSEGFEDDLLTKYRRQLMLKEVAEVVEGMKNEYPVLENNDLCGLIKLIGHYLISAHGVVYSYPKNFSSLLLRTDFAAMFESLPSLLKRYLRNHNQIIWMTVVDEMNRRLGLDGIHTRLFRYGVYRGMPLSHRNILGSLSKRDWLENIPQGRDLLTSEHFSNRQRAYELESLGSYGDKMDMVGEEQNKKAPIIEFRNLRDTMSFKKWKSFAQECFRYVAAVNNGTGEKFGERS